VPIALFAAHSVHAQSVQVESTPYPSVTDERLLHPEAGDWLMYRRTYDGWGFSPLKQITSSNIQKLSPAWSMSTDLLGAHETTAIVNRGRMFITTPQNNIIALDAKTGTQLWRYARKYPDGLFQLHPTNRGVALYGDYVYMATTDCALVALDAATGTVVWDVPFDDYKTGCYSTLAPLAVHGKIIAGYSGGELGVRGSLSAFDALTGKRIWKTYTVPAPNEPGGETWKGETYKRGGGSTWITGVYDPASNTTYWGMLSASLGTITAQGSSDKAAQFVIPPATNDVTPFNIHVPQAALDDLKERLADARWPDKEPVTDWSQGVPLAKAQALTEYWRTHYDWRRIESALNGLPQFRTQIDGLGIYFIHVRSKHENALPIILTHGWPGSIIEFLQVIGPLTDPTAHGGKADEASHVVIPCLPGFGFSDKPIELGWGLPRIANAWAVLMARLGYSHYVAQGGDWGAGVTSWMGDPPPVAKPLH
jgi:hypothetical protein